MHHEVAQKNYLKNLRYDIDHSIPVAKTLAHPNCFQNLLKCCILKGKQADLSERLQGISEITMRLITKKKPIGKILQYIPKIGKYKTVKEAINKSRNYVRNLK